jgi:VCBS repeat-containing protein
VAWSYDVANSKFNFLGADETLTLTYAAIVDDGHGGVITQPFTVTITGSNDAPTIAVTSGALAELPEANNSTIDHAGGTVTFADVDLTDRPVVSTHFTSFTYQDGSHHDVSSSLSAQQLADIAAVEASLTLTPSATNASNGSVAWSYDVIDSKLNFLGADETLTLTYSATVDDGHGGVVTQPFTVTITGSNDAPTIAVTSGAFTELPGPTIPR